MTMIEPDSAPQLTAGAHVIVTPPMTPMARHEGRILARGRGQLGASGCWRVEFIAWGVRMRETLPASALQPVGRHQKQET